MTTAHLEQRGLLAWAAVRYINERIQVPRLLVLTPTEIRLANPESGEVTARKPLTTLLDLAWDQNNPLGVRLTFAEGVQFTLYLDERRGFVEAVRAKLGVGKVFPTATSDECLFEVCSLTVGGGHTREVLAVTASQVRFCDEGMRTTAVFDKAEVVNFIREKGSSTVALVFGNSSYKTFSTATPEAADKLLVLVEGPQKYCEWLDTFSDMMKFSFDNDQVARASDVVPPRQTIAPARPNPLPEPSRPPKTEAAPESPRTDTPPVRPLQADPPKPVSPAIAALPAPSKVVQEDSIASSDATDSLVDALELRPESEGAVETRPTPLSKFRAAIDKQRKQTAAERRRERLMAFGTSSVSLPTPKEISSLDPSMSVSSRVSTEGDARSVPEEVLEEATALVRGGTWMLKHTKKGRGKPHARFVQLDPDTCTVTWGASKEKGSKTKSVVVKAVTKSIPGFEVHKSLKADERARLMIIVTSIPQNNIMIVPESKEHYDKWMMVLGHVLRKRSSKMYQQRRLSDGSEDGARLKRVSSMAMAAKRLSSKRKNG